MREVERRFSALEIASPDAFGLARLVSFAVRADPALIRTARLELLPGVGVGAEGALWFSPAVEMRTVEGIVLHADVAELLRRHLASEAPALYERAWELTRRVHASHSPAILLEEEVSYLLHSRKRGSRGKMRELFLSAVATLVGEGAKSTLAPWAARALTRFPSEVRSLDEAKMLHAGAQLRLEQSLGRQEPIDAERAQHWIGIVRPREVRRREVGLRRWRELLEVVDSSAVPASQRISLPDTDPLVLEIGVAGRRRAAEPDGRARAKQILETIRRDERYLVGELCGELVDALGWQGEPSDLSAEDSAVHYRAVYIRPGETARFRIEREPGLLRTMLGEVFAIGPLETLPEAIARELLETLRDQLYLEPMQGVARALVESGNAPASIRRLWAEALIEAGELARALEQLDELGLETMGGDFAEHVAVCSALAHVYGLISLQLGLRDDTARTALGRAVRLHLDLREVSPEHRTRHGVAAAALLRRAEREGWLEDGFPPHQELAEEGLRYLAGQSLPSLRALIVAIETSLAMDEVRAAVEWSERLVKEVEHAPDLEPERRSELTPYDVASLIWRVRWLWGARA
jgi:hypothetical protein